jgi:hypothetical protein
MEDVNQISKIPRSIDEACPRCYFNFSGGGLHKEDTRTKELIRQIYS